MEEYKCKECDKLFTSNEGLNQHYEIKHEGKKIKIKKSHGLLFIVIVLGIFLVYWFYLFQEQPNELDNFAKCLTEKETKFYGAWWCPHCNDQKKLFGNSMKFVNYIECSTPDGKSQTSICIGEDIKGYPTWEFQNKTRINRVMQLNELSNKTGCFLN